MKRTIIQNISAVKVNTVPPDLQGSGGEGAKSIDFIHPEGAELITILLPADLVAEVHEGTAPDSGIRIETRMPPFPPPGETG